MEFKDKQKTKERETSMLNYSLSPASSPMHPAELCVTVVNGCKC